MPVAIRNCPLAASARSTVVSTPDGGVFGSAQRQCGVALLAGAGAR